MIENISKNPNVIKIADIVSDCDTHITGDIIYNLIMNHINSGRNITLSFKDVSYVTPSFVNNAFIKLLKLISIDYIKKHIKIIDCNRQVCGIIKNRFNKKSKFYA